MPTTCICDQLRAWCQLYPDRLASAERNAAARAHEDSWFGRFAGTDTLEREQVIELVDWKFQSMAHRRALAMRGISPERWEGQGGVADLIRQALADTDRDDEGALMTLPHLSLRPGHGKRDTRRVPPWQLHGRHSRALKALRGLGQMPTGPPGFQRHDWLPYLDACRSLADLCALSLREVDRALWIAADDPNLENR